MEDINLNARKSAIIEDVLGRVRQVYGANKNAELHLRRELEKMDLNQYCCNVRTETAYAVSTEEDSVVNEDVIENTDDVVDEFDDED